MNKIRYALLALSVAAASAGAQEGLLDIYQRALMNDPAIREAEANYLATAEVKNQARAGYLPTLSLSASTSDSYGKTPSPPVDPVTGGEALLITSFESHGDNSNVGLSLSQTIFDWGQILSMKQADKTIARAEADYAATQQDLMIRVASAYFNVLGANDQLSSDIAAREALAQQLEQTQRRFDVGLIAITDVQDSQAGYDQAAALVIASERTLATSLESLREIIDDYVTELESPIEELPLLTPDPADVEAWVTAAQSQNLALVSSRIGAEIADDEIRISRSARFPTLRLSAQAGESSNQSTQISNLFNGTTESRTSNSDPYNHGLSLNLSMPILNGGMNRSRVEQSVYRHRAALESLERVARQTERLTRDAYLGVTSEISRVGATRQALESARTALLATQAGFDVGQRTGVDVVNAQNTVRRAETTYAGARYEYLLNLLRLKQAAGSLSEMDLAEVDGWLE
jgi:outer membrane protein